LPTPDWPTRNLPATNHRLRWSPSTPPRSPVTLTSIRASGKVTLMSRHHTVDSSREQRRRRRTALYQVRTRMHYHTQNAHYIDLGQVNFSRVIFGVSGPTKVQLVMPFTACRYLYLFQKYSRSNSKVVVKRTKF